MWLCHCRSAATCKSIVRFSADWVDCWIQNIWQNQTCHWKRSKQTQSLLVRQLSLLVPGKQLSMKGEWPKHVCAANCVSVWIWELFQICCSGFWGSEMIFVTASWDFMHLVVRPCAGAVDWVRLMTENSIRMVNGEMCPPSVSGENVRASVWIHKHLSVPTCWWIARQQVSVMKQTPETMSACSAALLGIESGKQLRMNGTTETHVCLMFSAWNVSQNGKRKWDTCCHACWFSMQMFQSSEHNCFENNTCCSFFVELQQFWSVISCACTTHVNIVNNFVFWVSLFVWNCCGHGDFHQSGKRIHFCAWNNFACCSWPVSIGMHLTCMASPPGSWESSQASCCFVLECVQMSNKLMFLHANSWDKLHWQGRCQFMAWNQNWDECGLIHSNAVTSVWTWPCTLSCNVPSLMERKKWLEECLGSERSDKCFLNCFQCEFAPKEALDMEAICSLILSLKAILFVDGRLIWGKSAFQCFWHAVILIWCSASCCSVSFVNFASASDVLPMIEKHAICMCCVALLWKLKIGSFGYQSFDNILSDLLPHCRNVVVMFFDVIIRTICATEDGECLTLLVCFVLKHLDSFCAASMHLLLPLLCTEGPQSTTAKSKMVSSNLATCCFDRANHTPRQEWCALQGPANCMHASRVWFQEFQEFHEFQETATHFKSVSRVIKRWQEFQEHVSRACFKSDLNWCAAVLMSARWHEFQNRFDLSTCGSGTRSFKRFKSFMSFKRWQLISRVFQESWRDSKSFKSFKSTFQEGLLTQDWSMFTWACWSSFAGEFSHDRWMLCYPGLRILIQDMVLSIFGQSQMGLHSSCC